MADSTDLVPDGVTSWTREAARRVVRDCHDNGHPIRDVYGYAPYPDHNNRRCVDFMLHNFNDGRWIAPYMVRYQKQLKCRLLIFNGRIWRSYWSWQGRPGVWHKYVGTTNPHTDHVHGEFAE